MFTVNRFLSSLALAAIVSGCGAGKAKEQVLVPDTTSFSDLYQDFNCDQLYSEAVRIAKQMDVLAADYQGNVANNRMAFFGSVVYWPILLITDDLDPLTLQEYQQLDVRMAEINQWSNNHGCEETIDTQAQNPDPEMIEDESGEAVSGQ